MQTIYYASQYSLNKNLKLLNKEFNIKTTNKAHRKIYKLKYNSCMNEKKVKDVALTYSVLYNWKSELLRVKRFTRWIFFVDIKNETRLNISHMNLIELPKEIGNLRNLKYLYINHNSLKKIPKQIKQLANLEVLEIDRNELSTFPNIIHKLANLRRLDIDIKLFHQFKKKITIKFTLDDAATWFRRLYFVNQSI